MWVTARRRGAPALSQYGVVAIIYMRIGTFYMADTAVGGWQKIL